MIIQQVKCDVCGADCGMIGNGGYAELFADWGYGSNYDGEKHKTIICHKCYNKLPIPKVVIEDGYRATPYRIFTPTEEEETQS